MANSGNEPPQAAEPPIPDVEGGRSSSSSSNRFGGGLSSIISRVKREDLLKKGCLILRALALIFSLFSFIIMATNNHGDWKNFNNYEEYRYLLAIAILSTLYTGFQILSHLHLVSTGNSMFQQRTTAFADFVGDQVIAYLLISAASAAVPLTNRMREGADNIFTDSSAASISMAFFAFFSLALSAVISGFKLSTQTYL